jgi:hypothetical protein
VELRAARLFLTGYLAYLSGREPAGMIRDATSGLSRALTNERLVIAPATATHPARIASLTSNGQTTQLTATAVINDGELPSYQLTLQLTDEDGHLLVKSVGGAQ